MECPFCGHKRTEVYNSRTTGEAKKVWRRRRCQSCNEAFTTYEASGLEFIMVKKRDGSKQHFSRSKLLISIYFACQGWGAPLEDIDAIVDTVESRIIEKRKQEISTETIANSTATTLKHFHIGAYMRYLSYRDSIANMNQLRDIAHNLE